MIGSFDRREVIGAAVLAVAVIGVSAAVVRSKRAPESEAPTERQLAVARQVAQVLIPRTDTPGGADVGADKFLVLALAHGLDGTRGPDAGGAIQGATVRYRRSDGSLDHLAWLERELDDRSQGNFITAPLARQQAALQMIDKAAFATHQTTGPWPKIKGLLLTGYYTSEAGGSKELNYELVPGRFDPDLPLKPGMHAYSSDWTAVEFG
ncbi:gluconate 2-dehydrogenase subunit 3 family protein [Glacieibacterium megasporae]|uniref:gluconate 2-dehydrogenase subunit 3 family protein n=1 Tax=Glacieibacterium megasporae TaxID=2835787 RepID=UPI001C1E56F0|nr:gluconate 2-dehydrogenase subunit 3 family protein [Polymorphobacter megasporae]UAJ11089.1 gluconate 2-dehydrogenase subunit 3 family protein [Polymorphobacter megasporae]